MSKIGLSEGTFTLIPEGTHVFKITAVKYKEDFGKLEISMETQSGLKHIERFSLLSSNGSNNQGALNAFSYFAKTVLNDFSLQEIDHEDLVGHFIECDVEHDIQPSNKDPNKNVTFIKLADKRTSDGWDDAAPAKATSVKKAEIKNVGGKPKVDLNALLG